MIIKPFSTNCILTVDLTGEVYSKLIEMPGFKKWQDRDLIFRPTNANLAYLLTHFPDATWQDGAQQHVQMYQQQQQEIKLANKQKGKKKLADKSGYRYHTKPYDHQRKAFLLSREKLHYALLMDQGTGKTKVIIDTAAYLYLNGRIDALVIVAPNGIHQLWIDDELPKHLPDTIGYRTYLHQVPVTTARAQQIEQTKKFKGLRVFAFNIEGLTNSQTGKQGKYQSLLESILQEQRCLLVVDESTRIKNIEAQRTKFLIKTGKRAVYRRIMTGTISVNGIEDLYAQFTFLHPDILGFDSFYTFRDHFCITQQFGSGRNSYKIIQGYRNVEELTELIAPYSFRVLKSECLDLPEKIYKLWPVQMTSLQREKYEELKREYMAELDGEVITAELAMTRLLRLQQIACGWWPGAPLRAIDSVNTRLQAVEQIADHYKGKVIVWARFRADLELLQQHLGPAAVSYHGGISPKEKVEAKNRFQSDPAVRWFLGNQQSAGLGLTLTAAELVVYYSNSFSLEHRLQSEDRAHRIGQCNNVLYIDLQATGTVDKKIIKDLRSKKDIADMITRDPKSNFLEFLQ